MEVENQLSMSLDDIINKNKKQRPVGSGKQQVTSLLMQQIRFKSRPSIPIVS